MWMVRNVNAVGDPMGPHAEASASISNNVYRVANELSQWVATQLAPPAIRAVVLAGVIVAVVAIIALQVRRGTRLPDDWRKMAPLCLLVAAYVGYLVASASIVAFGAINTRFLLPVFVPIVVLAAWLFERFRDRLESRSLRNVVTAIGIAWVAVNVVWFAGRAVKLRAERSRWLRVRPLARLTTDARC